MARMEQIFNNKESKFLAHTPMKYFAKPWRHEYEKRQKESVFFEGEGLRKEITRTH